MRLRENTFRTNPPPGPQRTLQELGEIVRTDPDPEYRDAINENIVVLARKKARLAQLESST